MLIIHDVPITENHQKRLSMLSPKISLANVTGYPSISTDILKDAEVFYTAAANFDPLQAPKLRLVQTSSVAMNLIADKPLLQTSIPVANVRGAYTPAVAECAMGLLLTLIRRIHIGVHYQTKNIWPDDQIIDTVFMGEELYGKTIGLVGYGNIGRHIARIANAFGMKILACDRAIETKVCSSYCLADTGDPEGILPKAWFDTLHVKDMLRQCDVVMLTLPGVPSTRNFIASEELAAIPAHAYLINVGRGSVINEPALTDAIKAGQLAGVGLDVFNEEPLPSSSPLWNFENVVIMPHIASWTDQQVAHANDILVENTRRLLSNLPLINLIDKKLLF